MDFEEFSNSVSGFFLSNGLDWAESQVRETLDQGIPGTRKEVTRFGMSAEVASLQSKSTYFEESQDYTLAFERRGREKSVETTRRYTSAEEAQLYAQALYSVFFEPVELAKEGLKLLRTDGEIVFASEDNSERFDVRRVAAELSESHELQRLLESVVKNATRS